MVATQSFSISRRTLDVEDYIDIGRRHAGWIVGPAFFGMVASICVAFILPNEYTSKATMQITPAQISETMVASTLSNSLSERIQQMETQILSRNELSSIINDPRLLLYKDDLKTKPIDDVIEDMKNNIHINVVALPGALGKRASAFDINFTYSDRFKAKLTVEALMNKFDEQNTNTQKSGQDALQSLVGDLLQKARADLSDATDKLTAFKEGNAGKLPEQVPLNIARQNSFTAKIQSATEQVYRDQQSLGALDNARSAAKGRLQFLDSEEQTQAEYLAAAQPGSPAAQQNQDLELKDKQIEQASNTLEEMRKRFNDKFPEVRAAQNHLDSLKTQRDALAKKIQAKADADAAVRAASDSAKPTAPVKKYANPRVAENRLAIEEELKRLDNQEKLIKDDIEKAKKEQEANSKEAEDINQLLKDSTGLEGAYEELKATKTMAETHYAELEKKQEVASEQSQLIQRKAGEVLDVLDNASLPVAPTKPNRYMIIGAGFAMSLVLGLAMAGLQEAKDTSLKNLKDVRAYTNLPVLCSIPLLENTMLVKRKRRLTYLAWAASVIAGAAFVSAAVVYYYNVTMKS